MSNRVLIVTGTRDRLSSEDESLIELAIDEVDPGLILVGDCPAGVDKLVTDMRGWPTRIFSADWKNQGKGAGPIRNRKMVDYAMNLELPKYFLAFPGPKSKGTIDCITACAMAGIPGKVIPVG